MMAYAAVLLLAPVAWAAPRVEMVLVTDPDFSATSSRDWYQFVLDAKVDNLQIRQARATDKPDVVVRGTDAQPIYRVTGVLTGAGRLQLPGKEISLRDATSLKAWLTTLRNEGPARAGGAPRQPFGLSAEQLLAVHKDLSQPFDFSTKGLDIRSVLSKLGQKLKHPLLADAATLQTVTAAEKIADELNGVASGTALACLLRPSGLALVPRLGTNRQPELLIAKVAEGGEAWPVGWPPKKPERNLLPGNFELVNVELEDVPLSQVTDAISERLKTPFLFDHNGLARKGIDPAKVMVSQPNKQTMYDIVLRKTLFKAGLRHEVRVDEADKPLVWISVSK